MLNQDIGFKAVLDRELLDARRAGKVPGLDAWERIIEAFKKLGGPECLIPALAKRERWLKKSRALRLSDDQANYQFDAEVDDAVARDRARPRLVPPDTTYRPRKTVVRVDDAEANA